jgi:hypothetical protein
MKKTNNSVETEHETPEGEVLPVNRVAKVEEELSAKTTDFFTNCNTFRIDQSEFNKTVAKKLLLTIPVGKPNKQQFFRTRPGEDYKLNVAIVELKNEREVYLVLPSVMPILEESEFYYATMWLYKTRQGNLGIWPVKLPSPDGRRNDWNLSAAEAAEIATTKWVKLVSNMALGAYEVSEAVGSFPDPEWPDKPFNELLRIAFKGRVIDNANHLVIQQLRGLV